jgi:hypothetical protein
MLTNAMPAVMRALQGSLPPAALKQLTQALGNCNQQLTHRGDISVRPDAWSYANNSNGTYNNYPPSNNEYNQYVNNSAYNQYTDINNSYYNNATYNTSIDYGDTIIVQGGPPGDPGQDGRAGRDGTDGSAGADGQAGAAGEAGPAGSPGAAGGNGRDGRDGGAGRDGAPGAPGGAGAAGADGAAGAAGRDGAGIDSLRTKTFAKALNPKFAESVEVSEKTYPVSVYIDPDTCTASGQVTVQFIKAKRVCTEVNVSYGDAYAP